VLTDAGKRVILIEQSADMYGGTCPNIGCVPTKMLVHHSNSKRPGDDAQRFFANSIAGVRALTSAFRAGNFEALDGKDTATVITGAAHFVDPHTVAVGEGDDRITVTSPTILINTASQFHRSPQRGLRQGGLLRDGGRTRRRHVLARFGSPP
jgi:pyruvate/2-oxoglutarate dehydrogenase complex dihydrolipoamide dehydrogenase (E3) component